MRSIKENLVYAVSLLLAAGVAVSWDVIQNSTALSKGFYIACWILLVCALLKSWHNVYIKKDPLVVGRMTFSHKSMMVMLLVLAGVASLAKASTDNPFLYQYLNNVALAAIMSFVVGLVSFLPSLSSNHKNN